MIPLFYEIYHYSMLRVWKDQIYEEGSIPNFSIPPTENIRKIGDSFITFIQQMDTDDMVKLSSHDQIYADLYNYLTKANKNKDEKPIEFMEMIPWWICIIGNAILEFLKLKLSNIEILSEQGANQMKNDFEYIIKILSNFNLESNLLCYFQSVIYSLNFTKIEKIRELQEKNLSDYTQILKDRADIYFNHSEMERESTIDHQSQIGKNQSIHFIDYSVVNQVIFKIMKSRKETNEEDDDDEEEEEKTTKK